MKCRVASLLLLASCLVAGECAQGAPRWGAEVDLLPVATGGWYASLVAGRDAWRLRLVAAEVKVPDRFAPSGWEKARTRAQALLVDRFFREDFTGPWIGGGVERWDEDLTCTDGGGRVRLKSLQATFGAGWVVPLGGRFYVNPWAALHQRVAGDRTAPLSQGECRPRALQGEASIKIGARF
jgi:hypothetical protein